MMTSTDRLNEIRERPARLREAAYLARGKAQAFKEKQHVSYIPELEGLIEILLSLADDLDFLLAKIDPEVSNG
jgi:hypothetical protein